MPHNRKKKKNSMGRLLVTIIICFLLFAIILTTMIVLIMQMKRKEPIPDPFAHLTQMLTEEPVSETEELFTESIPLETQPAAETEEPTETEKSEKALELTETDIYTFMQGPKAYGSKTDWGGSWCDVELYDQKFSVFGCGLCCLANIYSTLTDGDCSPLDMFYYAKENSGYRPMSYYGSIDWPYMKQTLRKFGIHTKLKTKDKTYKKFQEEIKNCITATILISSGYDATYWHDVEGHYVNVWLYDEEDDTVFLADSGNPDHNRQRIPLRYLYDAMKMSSRYQYMLVTSVDEGKDSWAHNGVEMRWNVPDYYKGIPIEFPPEENETEIEE